MRVGIIRDERYLEHITDDFHPENAHRLLHIYAMLEELDPADLVMMKPRMATHEEVQLIHDASYVDQIAQTKGKIQKRLDPDTVTSPRSYDAALTAVGGLLDLVDAVVASTIDNGFALVRPPGHHAESGRAMGFCIFNNVAIAARYAAKKHGMDRVLVVDFDVHHGNGTQHAFYGDPSVLYVSIHQYPFYPGTGWFDEIGEGNGRGYTVNVPLSYGAGDGDYEYVFEEVVAPVALAYQPQIVIVSAGYDIHRNDPIGGMSVSEEGVAKLTRKLVEIAEKTCGGKLVFSLEGGYDYAALTNSVRTTIMELRKTSVYIPEGKSKPSASVKQAVEKARELLRPFWTCF